MRHLLIVGVLAGFLSACGSSPTRPDPPLSVAGEWSGPTTDTYGGQGTFTLTLTQSGSDLTGYWLAVSDDTSVSIGGLVLGSLAGTSLSARLTPGDPALCSYTARATIWGANMNGTFFAMNCSVPVAGTFNLLRTR